MEPVDIDTQISQYQKLPAEVMEAPRWKSPAWFMARSPGKRLNPVIRRSSPVIRMPKPAAARSLYSCTDYPRLVRGVEQVHTGIWFFKGVVARWDCTRDQIDRMPQATPKIDGSKVLWVGTFYVYHFSSNQNAKKFLMEYLNLKGSR